MPKVNGNTIYRFPAWVDDPYGHPLTAEQAKLRDLCRSSLKFLCKEMLGMKKWDDSLHNPMADFMEKSGRSKMVLIPRGHLKSSIVTIGWSIQQLLRNPDLRILIRNAVWDKSRTLAGSIQGFLEGGHLPLLFGKFKKPSSYWTKDGFTIAARNSKIAREPSVSTAGLETSLTGYHYDIIVDDDLVDQQNSSTKEQIQKVIDVYNDSFNLLDRGGVHVVIGTRWNLKDLYGHIINTDLNTVNGIKLKAEDGGEGWRKAYNQSIQHV